MLQYQYLVGLLILALPLFLFLFKKKNNRRAMIHSGIFFTILMTFCFVVANITTKPEALSITPGYWSPTTLFNLGAITGGLAIEDILFMFLFGGIAAVCVEFILQRKIKLGVLKRHHYFAFLIAAVGGYIFYKTTHMSLMWSLIAFNFSGALYIMAARKDLIAHSILGGLIFGVLYFILFFLFNVLFKDFILLNYNLPHLVGVFIFGVPIEEIIYGISLGMFWSPEIEYEYKIKN